jgi:GntR family transcriptional regulator, trigonelline degradation regulator
LAGADGLRVERNPAPIRAQVVDRLRQAILNHTLVPGQRLVERELVELTGVSRTSVREALRELAAEGLVTTVPNKGTVVTSITTAEARQLYEVRATLEALAGRLFVKNATDAERKALVKALGAIERCSEKNQSMLKAKDRFYDVLLGGTGNEQLRAMANGIHERVRVLRSFSLSVPGRTAQSITELRTIVAAIEANDADAAAAACSAHVEAAGSYASAALGDDPADEVKLAAV